MRARLFVLVVLASCQRTETVTRVVNLHLAGSCMIPAGSVGDYVALGDYDPPAQNHSSILQTDVGGQTIDGIPENVASLALLATPPDASQWQGVVLVPPAGDVDMLLLPAAASCAPTTPVGFISAMTFGAVSPQTLIASGAPAKSGAHPSFLVDLSKGHVAQMTFGMKVPRTQAAFAALGDGRAIVSGGLSGSVPQSDMEIFEEASGDFDPQTYAIDKPRADHSAVMLASGAMFLVGGQNAQEGLVSATALVSYDASKSTWDANESNSPPLAQPRINASAIRLADGNVLVGGGFSDTQATTPTGVVELFMPDASDHVQGPAVSVPAKSPSAFVALEGGGALYVCASDASINENVWFVNESGAQPIANISATDVKLFPRAGGGAILWNGSSWLAFDPWNAATPFSSMASAPSSGPSATSPIATSDPGMRAWVNQDGTVSLWRDGVRNEFASDDSFLGASGTALLAPGALPAPSFDAQQGLTLADPGQSVFVSDSRYLDVAVDVTSAGSSLPRVVLRLPGSEIEVGGASCPYPTSTTVSSVHVVRVGGLVQFATDGALSTCTTIDPTVRVAVGVRGGGSGSRVTALRVARQAR